MPLQPTTRDTHAPLPTHVTKGLGRCAEVLSRLAWYCQSWRSPADSTTRGRLQSEKRDTAINNLYVLELKYQNTYTFNTMSMRVSYRMLQAFNFCFFYASTCAELSRAIDKATMHENRRNIFQCIKRSTFWKC